MMNFDGVGTALRRSAAVSVALLTGVAGAPLVGVAGAEAAQAQQGYPTEPPPPLDRNVDVEFPEVARDTLANGLELVVVENHEQPVVSVRLYLPAGEVANPDGRAGIAGLTASVIDEGTESRSSEEIARTIEGVGASLGTGTSSDNAFVFASTLTEHLPIVLEVMGDVVQNPTFPADEFDTEKKRELSSLRVQLSQPGILASRAFLEEVYGQHPYADEPTIESVESITREDLESFHARRYAPDGSLLVFAGDISPQEARQAAERWFGDWEGDTPREVEMPAPPPGDGTHAYLVHRPGSVQSNIWVGHLGIRPGNADAYALDVLNQILGGGTNARLFLILREEKGWTYGAYSRFSEPSDIGYFAATAEVRTAVTDSALAELLHQLRRIRQEPVTQEEVDEAKQFLTGSFPLRIETPQQVASQVADVLLRGLPIDYLETYRSHIREVTREDVQAAAREYIHPDSSVIVIVGDATAIYDGVAALAPVTLYNEEGEEIALQDLAVQRSEVALDAGRIRTGTFGYSASLQGRDLGAYTITLREAEGGNYEMRQELAGMMSQQVTTIFTPDLEPVSLTREAQMGPIATSADLAYEGGRVSGRAAVPQMPEGGQDAPPSGPPEVEEVAVDTALAPGTIDENMAGVAVLAAPLETGFQMELPAYGPRAGVSQVSAEVTGQETVETPAGTFDTWVVELQTADAASTLYVTREAPRFLVKQELAAPPLVLELQSIGGGDGVGEDGAGSDGAAGDAAEDGGSSEEGAGGGGGMPG